MGIYSSAFDEGVNLANKFTPTPQPTPQPKAPTPIAKPVAQPRKYLGGNIVDKAFDVLRTPEYAQAGYVQGGMDYAKSKGLEKRAPITSPIEFGKSVIAGVKNIPKAISERREYGREEGQYNIAQDVGLKGKYGQTAVNLGLSLAAPSLALGPIAKGVSKIPGVSKVTSKVGGLVQKGVDLARKTEPIARVVEKVNPYFRNQALGKLVKEAEERVANRQTEVVNTVMKSAKGLTPAEQSRIGQMLEGGVTANPNSRLAQVTEPLRKMAEDIGKEAVDMGLLNKESFEQYRGKYMSHIWNQMLEDGDKSFLPGRNIVQRSSGQFFKQRKGAEGYIKEFSPAMIKGLGTQVRDIEVAKMYRDIGRIYGKNSEATIPTSELSKDLLNTLLRTKPKTKHGLGVTEKGFTSTKEIGNDLLDVFRQYQPAHQRGSMKEIIKLSKTGKNMKKRVFSDIGMDIKGLATNVTGGIEKTKKIFSPKKSKLFAKTAWGDPKAKRSYAFTMKSLGIEPTESNLRVFLDKVGKLPGPKQSKMSLDVSKFEKSIPEGMSELSESFTSKGAGKVLADTALPHEVVDIMTRTMTPKKRGIFDKAYDLWKKGKTIYNPGYHARNLVSNQILSDMSTGDGLLKTGINYGKAVKEYKKGGEFLDAAKKANIIGRQNLGGAFDEAMDVAGYGKKQNILQKADKAVAGFQNASEETAKLNVFTTWVKKAAKEAGKSVQEALQDENIIGMAKKKAEEAIFSPYNLSKTERGLASKIVPFYSFTRQATPFVAKTALNKPGTLTKYEKGKAAVEGLSEDRTNEYRPESAKGQIRLPTKDKEGRSYYADPQYVLPWGSLGEDTGGNISRGRLPLGLSLAPQFTIPAELAMNKQLYYDQPITKSSSKSKQFEDYKNYLLRSLGPGVLAAGQKLKSAIAGEPDWAGRSRNIPSAISNFVGAKTASFVPEEQKKFDTNDKYRETRDIQYEINKWKKSNNPKKDLYIKELQEKLQEIRK